LGGSPTDWWTMMWSREWMRWNCRIVSPRYELPRISVCNSASRTERRAVVTDQRGNRPVHDWWANGRCAKDVVLAQVGSIMASWTLLLMNLKNTSV
jgi:hypothetical protein